MKSSEYVYGVTRIYRRLLDEGRDATEREISELRRIFSRDGFTDGYFIGKTERDMTGVRTERDKENSRSECKREFTPIKLPARAELIIRRDERARLSLSVGDSSVTVYGDVPREAISSPLDEDSVKARISKMGNTFITLSPRDVSLTLDEGLNLSPSSLNSLRREAVATLTRLDRREMGAFAPYTFSPRRDSSYRTIEFFSGELYDKLSLDDNDILSKFDVVFLPPEAYVSASALANGVSIPPVIFDTEWGNVYDMLKRAREKGAKYALVSNIGAITLAKELSLIPIGNFRLNITNGASRDAYIRLGVERQILSVELTPSMHRDIGGGAVVFGRIPLMITERCFMKDLYGCDRCSRCYITDRTGAKFPMMREYPHRNIIFNHVYTYMGDKSSELSSANIKYTHFILSNESVADAQELLLSYFVKRPLNIPVRRMGRREK